MPLSVYARRVVVTEHEVRAEIEYRSDDNGHVNQKVDSSYFGKLTRPNIMDALAYISLFPIGALERDL